MGSIYKILKQTAQDLLEFGQTVGWPTSSAAARNYTLLARNVRQALNDSWNDYSTSRNLSQPLSEEWEK